MDERDVKGVIIKLNTYLAELGRDCNKKIKKTGEYKDGEHFAAVGILEVIVKIKDLIDEQK